MNGSGLSSMSTPAVAFVAHATSSPLTLSPLDSLPLERLVTGDAEIALEHVRSLAEALTGADRDAVRLRLLSKKLAVEATMHTLLERILSDQLARRNRDSALLAAEALKGCTQRLAKLADAHRAESTRVVRPVLVVGHADQVNVRGG